MMIVNIVLLVVGCFMEAIAAMLILVPILVPPAMALGIDPVQFGLVFVLNLMIGTITPPVGVVLYVTANVAGISFERVTRATMPFLIPLLVVLAAITLWPPLTTWLPKSCFPRCNAREPLAHRLRRAISAASISAARVAPMLAMPFQRCHTQCRAPACRSGTESRPAT